MITNPLVAMIGSQFHLTLVLADSSLEVGFSPAMHMATASWPYHALPVEVADPD